MTSFKRILTGFISMALLPASLPAHAQTSAVCFRMQMEAANTYKQIVKTDRESLTISEGHSKGAMTNAEALSRAQQLVTRQQQHYSHLENTLTSANLLGCHIPVEALETYEQN